MTTTPIANSIRTVKAIKLLELENSILREQNFTMNKTIAELHIAADRYRKDNAELKDRIKFLERLITTVSERLASSGVCVCGSSPRPSEGWNCPVHGQC